MEEFSKNEPIAAMDIVMTLKAGLDAVKAEANKAEARDGMDGPAVSFPDRNVTMVSFPGIECQSFD